MSDIPDFVGLVDEVFTEESIGRKLARTSYAYRHHPSSASIELDGKIHGACLRQLFWRAKGEPESEPFDVTGAYRMAFGDYLHTGLLNQLNKSKKVSIQVETGGRQKVDPLTHEVSWRADALVSSDGEMGGLEIKTVQGEAISNRKYGMRYHGPKVNHTLQVVCYLSLRPDLKWFALVYYGRDTGQRLQFNFTRDHNGIIYLNGKQLEGITFKAIVSRWEALEDFLEADILPPRDYRVWLREDGTIQPIKQIKGVKYKSDSQCHYCAYATKCWSLPDAKDNAYQGE